MTSSSTRSYVAESYVRDGKEPEGAKTFANGVVRTVEYVGGVKVVRWDYTNDIHA